MSADYVEAQHRMPSPEISIVTPTFNRLDRIKKVLAAIAAQDYPREAFEVIVISDGSTDGTDAYLASLSTPLQLRPIYQSNQGPAAARNRGISEARGKFIVFIDDDVVPEPNLLSEHMKAHQASPRDAAVIGPLLTPNDFKLSPWVSWEQDMLVKQYDEMMRGEWKATARQFYTGNASINRELLIAAGGFDERFRRAEDVELAYRLADRGVEFIFAHDAVGWHYAERSFRSWSDAAYAYGKNDAIFARDGKRVWIIPVVREEFAARKFPLRLLVRACSGNRQLSSLAEAGLKGIAGLSGRFALPPMEGAAYSGLFGLRYYQGFLDEMGDPEFLSQKPT